MKNKNVRDLVLAAMFLAIGFVLPLLTGQIKEIGSALLPMHIPVLLCGFICGWKYGLCVGFVLPLARSLIFGMPPIYPTAVAMAFELAVYGLAAGLLWNLFKRQNAAKLYVSLIGAMLAGRVVWGAVMAILSAIAGNPFTWQAFAAGAFTNAVPGIIIQIIMIPTLMTVLDQLGVVRFRRGGEAAEQ